MPEDDEIDIFGTSVFSLFSELPPTLPPTGLDGLVSLRGISVSAPHTNGDAAALQAHGVWRSAVHLATRFHLLQTLSARKGLDVLELGAASGLPGLVLAKAYGEQGHLSSVTLSDYPDPSILSTLRSNIAWNQSIISSSVDLHVVGHAWGAPSNELSSNSYDLIIAADVLWMRDQHANLSTSLKTYLRYPNGEIFIVAGLHTGRHVIESFIVEVSLHGLCVKSMKEVALAVPGEEDDDQRVPVVREWAVERPGESNGDRSRWVVEIQLAHLAAY